MSHMDQKPTNRDQSKSTFVSFGPKADKRRCSQIGRLVPQADAEVAIIAYGTFKYTRHSVSVTNALASSIVLVCRPRAIDALTATRRDFLNALKAELPAAFAHLQRSNIAPVDLAQASIGPGMAV